MFLMYSQPRRAYDLTFTLIIACAIAFIFQLVVPLDDFFFVPAKAISRPWTFVTSLFLHAGFEHLFFNMVALLIFGTFLESRISRKTFLLIYFTSGIIGNIGYVITAPDLSTPGLGASGAIYGIMGALAVIEPYATVYVGFVPMPMIMAAFVWTLTELLGLFAPSGIAHGAHLGGLIFGVIYGFHLRRTARRLRY